jgi:hypothetical protein
MTTTDPTAQPRPVIVWDVVLTIILLVVGASVAFGLVIFSAFLAFASDGCGSNGSPCNADQISAGMLIAAASPVLLFVLATIVAIVRMVKRRIAFWVGILSGLLPLIGFGIGAGIVFAAVGMQWNM